MLCVIAFIKGRGYLLVHRDRLRLKADGRSLTTTVNERAPTTTHLCLRCVCFLPQQSEVSLTFAHCYALCLIATLVLKLVFSSHAVLGLSVMKKQEYKHIYSMKDTGAAIGGSVGTVLNEKFVAPLLCRAHSGLGPFESLLEYYKNRYHLLIRHNEAVEEGVENKKLSNIHEAMCGNDSEALRCAITSCHDLFWPLIARDFEKRSPTCAQKRTLEDRHWNKPTTNIQDFTSSDGSFQAFPHAKAITFDLDEPIPNPFPDLPTFRRNEIHMLSEITP